jgi:hypothetical protein
VNAQTSQAWITGVENTTKSAKFFSFNTPVSVPPAQQCGRVVFSDLHVAGLDQGGGEFPSACTSTTPKPQELALEFLLFDLGSCTMRDSDPPTPPGK